MYATTEGSKAILESVESKSELNPYFAKISTKAD